MDTFIAFVSGLIYGTGAEAAMPAPNHRAWILANPSPSGTAWFAHHVDRMLPAFEGWLASHSLPPIIPWNGTRPAPWDPSQDIALPTSLNGSFTGIATLEALGTALRNRYTTVAGTAFELNGLEKAPFSVRYWGYMKWAQRLRALFNGESVIPSAVLYDRDGTILSAIPFLDVYNQCHRSWHLHPTPAIAPTPGLATSAGQIARFGGVGMGNGEEFIRFHHDHNELLFAWLARQGQPAIRGINMSQGWPRPAQAANNPSSWTEPDSDPWINAEGGDTDENLRALTTVEQIGNAINGFHVSGHGTNSDITSLSHNNYVPRFFAWHGAIDNQWWLREPRFARWNAATGLRERVFRPVLSTDAEWPGMRALTIVRDPAAPADVVAPADAVGGLDLTSGAGTLRIRLLAKDPYDRPLTLRLRADVFDDSASTTTPVETIPESAHSYDIGPGGDFALDTEFTVELAFGAAFQSDDPTRANPAVGFVNSRIRVSGSLTVADGSDPGFVHRDFCELALVKEKVAPEIDLYLDLSSFGEDQVSSAMAGGEARFASALIVVVQDRTSAPVSISWPAAVVDEVKGLLTGWTPAAGLFAAPYQPEVVLWRETADTPFTGVTLELAAGPIPEDASLPENLPQRYTYFYDVVFAEGHDAFDGLAEGGARQGRLRVAAVDRAGNRAVENAQIKLFREANPFMRDGDPSWVSIDTRAFRMFVGDARFDGITLNAGQPNPFLQSALQKLNDPAVPLATRLAYFDDLPTNQADAALEYSAQITNHAAGTTRQVYNFALAKVRLQGAAGAAEVRAFFRLFRYTASNLIFDESLGYRFHAAADGRKVPLLGFTAAGELTSIPFFAASRVPIAAGMETQTDAPNVRSFPPGPTEERVLFFGAYLDINQSGAQLPPARIPAHPDGPFTAGEVQPIRSLMMDAHQCMVVEIRYDGDPTETGSTPASSDNLAQRNLLILTTDNPGAPLTHTVQHSFEVDQGCCLHHDGRQPVPGIPIHHHPQPPTRGGGGAQLHAHPGGPGHHDHDGHGHGGHHDDHGGHDQNGRHHHHEGHDHAAPFLDAERSQLRFLTAEHRERLIHEEAVSLAMSTPHEGHSHSHQHHELGPFLQEAAARVERRFPLVFDGARWQGTGDTIDELLFRWNDLPAGSRVELYLPGVRAENVLNLRHLRHAPGDVRIVDEHTLLLTPRGLTYVPLPPTVEERLAGVVTITLPEGIRRGQGWKVDVVQIRGGEQRTTGGFRIDVQVSEAKQIADAERRLLEVMFERLSLTPRRHRWYPVLRRRVETIRARARALAEAAGIPWEDPTLWRDPERGGEPRPFAGQKIRVVLEQMQILENREPWFKGRGEIWLACRVFSADNGGLEQRTRLPERGVFKISDKPGRNVQPLNQVIFTGYVASDLRLEVLATEKDTFDPDDTVGKYTRLLCGGVDSWIGSYAPDDEPVDPEEMGAWRLWYRIERA